MFTAAGQALSQMFTLPFRAVLLKSIGLALILIVLAAIGLQRAVFWLATLGEGWADGALGPHAHTPLAILTWVISIAAGFGIVAGSVLLMPAITALVASFFVDEIAEHVEREYYPSEPAGAPLPLMRALIEGVKTALLAVLVYLVATPFLLLAGFGIVIFFVATSYLLGREYFELAAMRYRPVADAKALRKTNRSTVFLAGMFIAAFVSIPVVNLATPLFGMAFMVHVVKRMTAVRPMIEAVRAE